MKESSILPNFIVVGAHRSGTTSLYHWLKEHPQVFLPPVKETNYFSGISPNHTGLGDYEGLDKPLQRDKEGLFVPRMAGIITCWSEYQDLYKKSERFRVRGEISPSYLYYPRASLSIREQLPQSKIIIVLRDPIDRAFSNYKALLKWGRETETFENALSLECDRVRAGWEFTWSLKGLGLYYLQVKRYIETFSRQQIGIWLYEDLIKKPANYWKELCDFIGVDSQYEPDFSRYNASRLGNLHLFLNKKQRIWHPLRKFIPSPIKSSIQLLDNRFLAKKIIMKPSTRRYLLEYFRDDIIKLQELLPKKNIIRWIEYQERILEKECRN